MTGEDVRDLIAGYLVLATIITGFVLLVVWG